MNTPNNTASRAGMNATQGHVIDSLPVESGRGRAVQELDGLKGKIAGNPARSSKRTRLKIGMQAKQVTGLIGQPTNQGASMTGETWVSFYFGSDRYRDEMGCKGAGAA